MLCPQLVVKTKHIDPLIKLFIYLLVFRQSLENSSSIPGNNVLLYGGNSSHFLIGLDIKAH